VQTTKPCLSKKFPGLLKEIRVVTGRIICVFRAYWWLGFFAHVWSGGVVVLPELLEQPVHVSVTEGLHISQKLFVKRAVEALHDPFRQGYL
jgi:hypothetical protein